MWTSLVVLVACGTPEPPSPEPAPVAPAAKEAPAPAANALIVAGAIRAADDLPAGKSVFVVVRPAGIGAGPPLAALRLPAGPFPVAFELTEANRPMAVGPIPDELDLKVTLDIDGNPMSPSPDDVSVIQKVTRGQREVEVELAR